MTKSLIVYKTKQVCLVPYEPNKNKNKNTSLVVSKLDHAMVSSSDTTILNVVDSNSVNTVDSNSVNTVDSNNVDTSLISFEGKILSLTYTPVSKLIGRDSLSNEELYKAELLGNLIRINSIALYKDWFKDVKDIDDITKIRKDIQTLLIVMRSVNSDGFINSNDVLKDSHYTLITEAIKKYRGNEDEIPSLKVSDRDRTKLFKWCHDRISLEALLALNILAKRVVDIYNISDKNEDVYMLKSITNEIADLRLAISELEGSIDTSLTLSIKRKGITFNHIRYTGFDNEYIKKDELNNELVSVQLSTNTRTLLKIPITRQYTYSKVTTLGGKFYEVYGYSNVIDNERLLRDFNILIDSYRLIAYNLNDAILESITQKLIDLGIPNIKIDDQIVFDFGRTRIKQWIKRFSKGSKFKFSDLVKISNEMTSEVLENEYQKILVLLKTISFEDLEPLIKENNNFDRLTPISEYSNVESVTESKNSDCWSDIEIKKGLSIITRNHEESIQLYNTLNESDKISKSSIKSKIILGFLNVNINRIYQNNFIGHFNSADLSMYEDYEFYKTQLDIIKHSFITIRKPIEIDNVRVRVYDSQQLSPASKKSLKDLGSLYDIKIAKVELPDPKMIETMHILAYDDWELFKKYALQDTVIPLVHVSFMEDFNFKLGCLGIPITLASLSTSMVQYYWKVQGYKGYQILPDVKIGDVSVIQTPKNLSKIGPVGEHMSLFIENIKGGRNESFMYGIDRNEEWFDYDLKGAYTTVMCLLGNPDYRKAKILSYHTFLNMDKINILYSYTVIKAEFKFPKDIKYPNIPVFVDKDTTVYPLEGEAIMTGAEYFTAQRMGCKIENIKVVFHIPFENLSDVRKEKDVLLKDFQKYEIGRVDMNIIDGRLRSSFNDKSDELVDVKDLNLLKSVKSLSYLKELIKTYNFEDFRQQPNKTNELLRFVINGNSNLTFKNDFVKILHDEILKDLHVEWVNLSGCLGLELAKLKLDYSLDIFFSNVEGLGFDLLGKFELLQDEVRKITDYYDVRSEDRNRLDFFSEYEGNILYNIQLIKILKLAEVSIGLIQLNSKFTKKDLNIVNLNDCFDINEVSHISNNNLNLTEFKNNELKTRFFLKEIVKQLKLFDDLNSETNRCLMFKTPFNLSSSNRIGWSPDLTPCSKFGSSNKTFINAPYRNLIIYLQNERAKHPKKTILNELYKEMANSVYGQTVRGIGIKNKFDAKIGDVKRMNVGELANPIIASWITAFVRSVIGEMLYYTDKMGGKVVSVTTDGFITNLTNLEGVMLDYIKEERDNVIKRYKDYKLEGEKVKDLIISSTFLNYIIEVRVEESKKLTSLIESKEKRLTYLIHSKENPIEVKELKNEIRVLNLDLEKLKRVIESEEKSLNSYRFVLDDWKRGSKRKKGKDSPTLKGDDLPILKGEDLTLLEQDKTIVSFSLLEEFRSTREIISNNPEAIEVKSSGVGLASWCVRGQLGLNSKITALTGFQKKGIDDKDLFNLITKSMTSFDKSLDYIHTTLRSATDIYKKGGHVTRVNRDQVFRTVYDNRRVLDDPVGLPTKVHIINEGTKIEFINVYKTLLDSRPMLNREQCDSFRSIAKIVKDSVIYNVVNRKNSNSLYQGTLDIALKQFIRALYSNKLNLESKTFKFYKDLCIWLNGFTFNNVENSIQLNPNKVALIKSRGVFINNSVPLNDENLAFVMFIKVKFPEFDESKFFIKN